MTQVKSDHCEAERRLAPAEALGLLQVSGVATWCGRKEASDLGRDRAEAAAEVARAAEAEAEAARAAAEAARAAAVQARIAAERKLAVSCTPVCARLPIADCNRRCTCARQGRCSSVQSRCWCNVAPSLTQRARTLQVADAQIAKLKRDLGWHGYRRVDDVVDEAKVNQMLAERMQVGAGRARCGWHPA